MLIQQPCSFFNLCSCSCLPWAAPRLCCRAPEPVKFPTPLHLRLHCPVFPISGSFQSGASPSSIASVRSARRGQHTRVIGRGLYVESLTAGTHEVHGRTQGKFLLITHCTCTVRGKGFYISRKNVPPADRSDPPAISSHARKCLLITHKKMNTPC